MQHSYPTASIELSETEKECLTLAAQGYSDKQIGRELGFSEGRVNDKMSDIYSKLGVKYSGRGACRTRAVLLAWQQGMITPPAINRGDLPHFQIVGLDETRARDAEIVRMHGAGASRRQICTRFGLSYTRINKILLREQRLAARFDVAV